jgi:hypothetical protein
LPPRWGWSPGDLIVWSAVTTIWAPPLQTLTLETENKTLKTGGGALPPTRAEIHRASMAQRPQRRAICSSAGGRQMRSRSPGETPVWTYVVSVAVSSSSCYIHHRTLDFDGRQLETYMTYMVVQRSCSSVYFPDLRD